MEMLESIINIGAGFLKLLSPIHYIILGVALFMLIVSGILHLRGK